MKPTQKPLTPTDPLVAKQAWHEAVEAHRIAALRRSKAKEALEEAQQRIKNAMQNGTVTTDSIQATLADLAGRQAALMVRVEECDAHVQRANKELKVAWTAYAPHATIEATAHNPPPIPRVSVMLAANKETMAGAKATETHRPKPADFPAGKSNDPTFPDHVAAQAAAKQVAAQAAQKPSGERVLQAPRSGKTFAAGKEAVAKDEDGKTPFPEKAAERAAARRTRAK